MGTVSSETPETDASDTAPVQPKSTLGSAAGITLAAGTGTGPAAYSATMCPLVLATLAESGNRAASRPSSSRCTDESAMGGRS